MRSDRESTRLFRLFLSGGAVILLLLSCAILQMFVVGPVQATVTLSSPPLSCPDAPPTNTQDGPSLTFCSPINQGFVGGPYGTHIVLVGENFPAGSITWFYSQNENVFDAKTLAACLSGSQGCPVKSLKNPTRQPSQSGPLFGWTWNADVSFPNTPGNYYIFAIISSQNGPVLAVSSVAFSLLSPQAPCVVASNNTSPDCSRSQQLSLTSSTLSQILALQGSNWLLQGPGGKNGVAVGAKVVITLLCAHSPTVQCNRMRLMQPTTANTKGSFTESISLPVNLLGTYDVCVASEAQTVATPITSIQNNDTVVNNSLTYGCTQYGDTAGLIITIAKPKPIPTPTPKPVPSPTPMPSPLLTIIGNVSDGLSIFGLFLIGAALLLFLLYVVRMLFAYPSTDNVPPGSPQSGNQERVPESAPSSFPDDRR